MESIVEPIRRFNAEAERDTGNTVYEHLIYRIKAEESMREKCRNKGLPETAHSALKDIHDAIGIRIITGYVDDIYIMTKFLKSMPSCRVVEEKDFRRVCSWFRSIFS